MPYFLYWGKQFSGAASYLANPFPLDYVWYEWSEKKIKKMCNVFWHSLRRDTLHIFLLEMRQTNSCSGQEVKTQSLGRHYQSISLMQTYLIDFQAYDTRLFMQISKLFSFQFLFLSVYHFLYFIMSCCIFKLFFHQEDTFDK